MEDPELNFKSETCIPELEDSESLTHSSGDTAPQLPESKGPGGGSSVKMVGLLTAQERQLKVQRYLDKKQKRKGEYSVRYGCRQDLAQKRFRFQGRFVKFEDLHLFSKDYIIDFNGRRLIKPIFRICKLRKRSKETSAEY